MFRCLLHQDLYFKIVPWLEIDQWKLICSIRYLTSLAKTDNFIRKKDNCNIKLKKQEINNGYLSSIAYMHEDGEIFSRSVRQSGIPDPLGEIFYVRKVVTALHNFVWRLIVGIALLESHSSFNFSCLFVAPQKRE